MIDWHTHILPGIDDGSKTIEESVRLLNMEIEQGIKTIIATPHFYANNESVSSFLKNRNDSYETLWEQTKSKDLDIHLGAEVQYYSGISHLENIRDLRIENTDFLLLEMPMTNWSSFVIDELIELSSKAGITLILAHVDRYLSFQNSKTWSLLHQNGILMQMNANSLLSFSKKRKSILMLKKGFVQFIGSDCHNTSSRPPKIGKAFEVIKKHLGEDYITEMNKYGHSLLIDNKK